MKVSFSRIWAVKCSMTKLSLLTLFKLTRSSVSALICINLKRKNFKHEWSAVSLSAMKTTNPTNTKSHSNSNTPSPSLPPVPNLLALIKNKASKGPRNWPRCSTRTHGRWCTRVTLTVLGHRRHRRRHWCLRTRCTRRSWRHRAWYRDHFRSRTRFQATTQTHWSWQ